MAIARNFFFFENLHGNFLCFTAIFLKIFTGAKKLYGKKKTLQHSTCKTSAWMAWHSTCKTSAWMALAQYVQD